MKKIIALALSLALVLGISACGTAADGEEEKLQDVTFALDWTPNTNHTGIYVAKAKGWFEEAGLNVTIVQPSEDSTELLVATNRAQFGVSFQDTMAPALVGSAPLPITAVAAVIQHNTSGIVSRAGEGIDHPAGMEGHTYATWDLDVEKATLRRVVEADGGNFDNVQLIPSNVTDEVTALSTNQVDSIWIFYGWAGVACQVAGLDTDYFAFADIDPVFDYYTPVLIANNDFLKDDPDAARAFLEAAKRGYEYAIENPEEAADILLEAVPELESNAELVRESQKWLAGQYKAEVERWGYMDPERWNGFYTWLNDNDLVESPIPENTGFTNDYLPE